jgi:tetratricopeptide (TPR) repeat protein
VSHRYEILSLAETETAPHRGSNLVPIRHLLGFRAAGVNAWRADAGGQLIPPHEEDSGDQELYVVVVGHATFTVGEETLDAPAGTLVFVESETFRTAVAEEDGTTVFVAGATIGKPFEAAGWDTFAVADGLRRAGRTDESRAVMQKAMADLPDSWALPYNAACLEALSGNADEAIPLLRRALELNQDRAETHEYLASDGDLDNIRDDPRFQELLA